MPGDFRVVCDQIAAHPRFKDLPGPWRERYAAVCALACTDVDRAYIWCHDECEALWIALTRHRSLDAHVAKWTRINANRARVFGPRPDDDPVARHGLMYWHCD